MKTMLPLICSDMVVYWKIGVVSKAGCTIDCSPQHTPLSQDSGSWSALGERWRRMTARLWREASRWIPCCHAEH
eukprot:8317939-Karenia_brevis.AAC.1